MANPRIKQYWNTVILHSYSSLALISLKNLLKVNSPFTELVSLEREKGVKYLTQTAKK